MQIDEFIRQVLYCKKNMKDMGLITKTNPVEIVCFDGDRKFKEIKIRYDIHPTRMIIQAGD